MTFAAIWKIVICNTSCSYRFKIQMHMSSRYKIQMHMKGLFLVILLWQSWLWYQFVCTKWPWHWNWLIGPETYLWLVKRIFVDCHMESC
jgi:hypothetical protein